MKTRNAGTSKSATTAKKTPPAKKSAADNSMTSPEPGTEIVTVKKTPPAKKSAADATLKSPESRVESATPKPNEVERTPATKVKQVKGNDTTPTASADSKPKPPVEEPKEASGVAKVTPQTKVVSRTRTVVRKVVRKKTPNTAKAVSTQSHGSEEAVKPRVEESSKEEVEATKDMKYTQQELPTEVGESTNKGQTIPTMNVGESRNLDQSVVVKLEESMAILEDNSVMEEKVVKEEEVSEEIKNEKGKEVLDIEPANVEEGVSNGQEGEAAKPEIEHHGDGGVEEHGDQEILEEAKEEVPAEDDVEEPADETDRLEEEHMELTAHAKERSLKKELEIFVGGLDRDAGEDDVKKAFEKVGEVVEVRLHKDLSNNRTKGYAFVKFANKEQANRALSEVKNPIICGKRCGTAPSEDNSTLFLGNICNTWTKEAIKQKMKDYGVDGVVNITLVADPRHEGVSRGFAFVEFSCHADAMLAYKRLQKPDVLFGHAERTAKVAFAEPIREPDPEIMALVKSVFIDGLPPHWDEDTVKNQVKVYGEIEKIVLGRNMSTAKRKDFGFVDFSTHEAAVACIDGINKTELVDGNSKIKVKARLSNPLPKTQAVKGGMCGGFRIGRGGGNSLQYGRGFGWSQPPNRENFQRGRGFYPHGRGQTGRMGFVNEQDFDYPYADFHGRQFFEQGGRRGDAGPAGYDLSGPSHGVIDRGRGRHFSSRRPSFSPKGGFGRPFVDRHFDDPYLYEDTPHGMKRPFYMTDPGYVEPSRFRPRLDYSDPAPSFRETHYRGTFGTGSGMYSQDYYGSDYGGAYSSFYGADQPYRGGYY